MNFKFSFILSVLVFHSAVTEIPHIEKIDELSAVACDSESPECQCQTPAKGCEVCCVVDEQDNIACKSYCASKETIDVSEYEEKGKKVVEEFQRLGTTTPEPTANTEAPPNVKLPVTMVESGGEATIEEPMVTTKAPPVDVLPRDCMSPEEQYKIEQEEKAV